MLKKFVLATTLVGSVLATGTSASAKDFAQAERSPTTTIDDFTGTEPRVTYGYVLSCEGWNQCEGLQRFCAEDGGIYVTTHDNGGTDIAGACVKWW